MKYKIQKFNFKNYKDGYSSIPNSLITNNALSINQKMIIIYLMSHKEDYELSTNYISKGLRMKWITVNKIIKELIIKDYLLLNNNVISINVYNFSLSKSDDLNTSNNQTKQSQPKEEAIENKSIITPITKEIKTPKEEETQPKTEKILTQKQIQNYKEIKEAIQSLEKNTEYEINLKNIKILSKCSNNEIRELSPYFEKIFNKHNIKINDGLKPSNNQTKQSQPKEEVIENNTSITATTTNIINSNTTENNKVDYVTGNTGTTETTNFINEYDELLNEKFSEARNLINNDAPDSDFTIQLSNKQEAMIYNIVYTISSTDNLNFEKLQEYTGYSIEDFKKIDKYINPFLECHNIKVALA